MRAKQFAVCDKDVVYLKMLQAYLQKKNPADFDILIFETAQKALAASRNEPFEVFLVGEKIYDNQIEKINAKKVFILLEDGLSGITGYSTLSKYQSMERLISQVLEEFALDESFDSVGRCGKNKTNLISFYAPDRNKGQSIAALGAAQVLAEAGHRVLYLNLMPFAGFEELLGVRYESDVTDFMYFVLNHSDKLLYKLDGIKQCIHGVDYLPPALDYTDLLSIGAHDWEQVLNMLLYSSDYTHIILDLSETCQGFYGILESSSQIYILTDKNTSYGRAMLSHYKNLLQAKGYQTILDHLEEFALPRDWEQYCDRIENIAASPIGSCMKGVLDDCR